MTQADYDAYYKAPSDEIFLDIKQGAIKIWQSYDNTYGYVTEKVSRIENIPNVRDNAAYMIAMFDYWNQNRLIDTVKNEETKKWLRWLIDYSRRNT